MQGLKSSRTKIREYSPRLRRQNPKLLQRLQRWSLRLAAATIAHAFTTVDSNANRVEQTIILSLPLYLEYRSNRPSSHNGEYRETMSVDAATSDSSTTSIVHCNIRYQQLMCIHHRDAVSCPWERPYNGVCVSKEVE